MMHDTHVLCLRETWHEDSDAISIKKLRADGLQVLEHSRSIQKPAKTEDCTSFINHGGVVILAPTNLKLEKVQLRSVPKTFQHLCARVTSRGASCIVVLLYRSGSQPVSTLFLEEQKAILEQVARLLIPIVVCGGTNVWLDRQEDVWTIRFTDMLTSFDLE